MRFEEMEKEPGIVDLITRLRERVGQSNVVISRDWDADLCAIGFTRPGHDQPLVYVSTFKKPRGRYWVGTVVELTRRFLELPAR